MRRTAYEVLAGCAASFTLAALLPALPLGGVRGMVVVLPVVAALFASVGRAAAAGRPSTLELALWGGWIVLALQHFALGLAGSSALAAAAGLALAGARTLRLADQALPTSPTTCCSRTVWPRTATSISPTTIAPKPGGVSPPCRWRHSRATPLDPTARSTRATAPFCRSRWRRSTASPDRSAHSWACWRSPQQQQPPVSARRGRAFQTAGAAFSPPG